MRVLHVHKFATVVGGVERHVADLIEAQRGRGYTVDFFTVEDVGDTFHARPTNASDAVASGLTLLWSRRAGRGLRERLDQFRPDIVHFHSVYHHLSPSVLRAARSARVPAVMTLHDYKLVAPCYSLFRDGEQCFSCVGRRVPVPAVRHRCIKHSVLGSVTCAAEHVAHAPLYRAWVDLFLVPSPFMARVVVASGEVPASRIRVIPLAITPCASAQDRETVVFLFGRVAPEKGFEAFLEAWEAARVPEQWRVEVAGTGSEEARLRARGYARTTFLGHLSAEDVSKRLSSAGLAVVPSVSPETFGLSAAEAMAHGTPLLASTSGNLEHLVGGAGITIPSGDRDGWIAAVRRVTSDPALREELSLAGIARAAGYSQEKSLAATETAYLEAISSRQRSGVITSAIA